MKKGIFCSRCGTNNQVSRFRCSDCHALIRPVYPTVLAVAGLCAVYFQWLLFLKHVVPVYAGILTSHGAKFSPAVRTALSAGSYFTGWGALLGLLFFAALLWVGLYVRPQKAWGRNLVLTIAVVKLVGAVALVLLATLDVLPFMARS